MFGLKRRSNIPQVEALDLRSDGALQVMGRDGNVITLAKPQPISVTFDELQDLAEYEEVAAVLNFAPPQIAAQKREIQRRELIGFMLDQGMPIYDNKQVHDYMAALAEKDDKAFVWKMLRNPDWNDLRRTGMPAFGQIEGVSEMTQDSIAAQRRLMWNSIGGMLAGGIDGKVNTVRTKDHGQLIGGPYGHPVPLDILKRGAKVKKQFPSAEIYVSDYAVVNPDPFIMAKIADCEHVVFGVWDEPGFGALGRDRK